MALERDGLFDRERHAMSEGVRLLGCGCSAASASARSAAKRSATMALSAGFTVWMASMVRSTRARLESLRPAGGDGSGELGCGGAEWVSHTGV